MPKQNKQKLERHITQSRSDLYKDTAEREMNSNYVWARDKDTGALSISNCFLSPSADKCYEKTGGDKDI